MTDENFECIKPRKAGHFKKTHWKEDKHSKLEHRKKTSIKRQVEETDDDWQEEIREYIK